MKKFDFILIHLCLSMLLVSAFVSCKKGPKIISTAADETAQNISSTGIFNENGTSNSVSSSSEVNGVHHVVAMEVLPTDKYVYVRVKENEEEFWIATGKTEIKIGQTYFYKNGLLKTNFESKEYKRTFDKVYLVGSLVSADHGANQDMSSTPLADKEAPPDQPRNIKVEGSIMLKEVIANPKKYAGKKITISGECVKINPNIMGRNWLHLKDGSKDDYDFVVTSTQAIPKGHVVTMSGILSLDKDFGAGYKYEMILENAEMVNVNHQ